MIILIEEHIPNIEIHIYHQLGKCDGILNIT